MRYKQFVLARSSSPSRYRIAGKFDHGRNIPLPAAGKFSGNDEMEP